MKQTRARLLLSCLIAWAAFCATAMRLVSAQAPEAQPQTAFAAGYQAYKRGDRASAIQSLAAAAGTPNVLGDYALFYLGAAQLQSQDFVGAAISYNRLAGQYPESIFRPRAELALARIALDYNQSEQARTKASLTIALSEQPQLQAAARLIVGRALIALNQPREAYDQLQQLRRLYPHSGADAEARSVERALLKVHPEIADTHSLSYLIQEAELLLSEGQSRDALATAQAALGLEPPGGLRASLLWIEARALHGQAARQEQALREYLAIAPQGPAAPEALYALARLYWHQGDTAGARRYFRQLASGFPGNSLAAGAMLRIGRTYEDDDELDAARSAYLQLAATHPATEAGADARFRSVWLLYQQHRFGQAASGFAAQKPHAADAIERAMYQYWQARSLEQSGNREDAQDILVDLAASTATNYYPELASRRVGAPQIIIPDPSLELPSTPPSSPAIGSAFHLERAMALRALQLYTLEANELRRVLELTEDNRAMRRFLLGEFQAAGAYYEATKLAVRMAQRGEISERAAERFRYPRAYWTLFSQAAARIGVKPYLLLALARQESLFDPMACSIADARGLMQLLPHTAQIVAPQAGVSAGSIDLYDPAVNIDLGSVNMKLLLRTFDGDLFKAIAAYNAGEDAVRRWNARFPGPDDEWVENIEYSETRNYVKKVIGGMREYQLLYPTGQPAL